MATQQRDRPQRWMLLVAAAGYGKTTALENTGGDAPTACHRATDLIDTASHVANPHPPARVAVDEVSTLSDADQLTLVRLLGALPGQPAVTLAARHPLADAALSACAVSVVHRGPETLALSRDAVARILRDEHSVPDSDLAYLVYELTAGWPRGCTSRATPSAGRASAGGAARGPDRARHRRRAVRPRRDPRRPASAGRRSARSRAPPRSDHRTAVRGRRRRRVRRRHRAGAALGDPHRAAGRPPRRQPGHTSSTSQLVRVLAAVLAQQSGRPDPRDAAGCPPPPTGTSPTRTRWRRHGPARRGRHRPVRGADREPRTGHARRRGAPEVTDLISALPPAERNDDLHLIFGDALRMSGSVTWASGSSPAAGPGGPGPPLAGTAALAGGDGAVPAYRLCRRPGGARPGAPSTHPTRSRRRAAAGLPCQHPRPTRPGRRRGHHGACALAAAQQVNEDARWRRRHRRRVDLVGHPPRRAPRRGVGGGGTCG
ncbi:hypothetical protein NKG94_09120 [Micromonospora sp. M12]